ATSLRAIPGLPAVVVGLESGVLVFVCWSDWRTPRIVQAIQLFTTAIKKICMDTSGELMAVVGSESYIYLVSCDPQKAFPGLGYIPCEEEPDSIALTKSQSNKFYGIIIGKRGAANFTEAKFFIITDEILEDPRPHMYPQSYQLRDDSLSMMSFKILLNIYEAYLTVTEPETLNSLASDDASIGSSERHESDGEEVNSDERKPIPKIILFSLTKNANDNSLLVAIDLSKEVADQVQ
uniref:WD repeat and coiled-coil-containing protein n=1 Tax=Mesocestoides corti TaxID=53468 RepID=A0A5K3ESP0_MESCO